MLYFGYRISGKRGEKVKNWKWASLVTACLLAGILVNTARAVTFVDTDTMGIQYTASVTLVSGSLYDVFVTINTSGYTGSQKAYLDWFNLKVSPQNPASVSNVNVPVSWSYTGAQAGKVEFQSAVINEPPDSSDIVIPVGGGPVVNLSYRVDLNGTSLQTDIWPYQARYLFETGKPNNPYTQTIVSRSLQPQGTVIPEPGTLFLFGAGLAAPLVARRRRR